MGREEIEGGDRLNDATNTEFQCRHEITEMNQQLEESMQMI